MKSLMGLGLRPGHYKEIEEFSRFQNSWFEVISENYLLNKGKSFETLMKLRESFEISLHGVSLNLASEDSISKDYLKNLKELIQNVKPVRVSDHLCWTGVEGVNFHDLMPFPYNKQMLDHVVAKIDRVQSFLGRSLLVENLSTYLQFKDSEMNEWEFIHELCHRTGCSILLDINNIFVNSYNHSFDPYKAIDQIDFKFVKEVHLAGYSDMGTHLYDTHSNPVYEGVWDLFRYFCQKGLSVPYLIEWDHNLPTFEILHQEGLKAQTIFNEEVYG